MCKRYDDINYIDCISLEDTYYTSNIFTYDKFSNYTCTYIKALENNLINMLCTYGKKALQYNKLYTTYITHLKGREHVLS